MAKAKNKDGGAKPGEYDPAELSEFIAELEGREAPSRSVDVDSEDQSHPRHVAVQVDTDEPDDDDRSATPSRTADRSELRTPPPEMQKLQHAATRPKPWGWLIGGLLLIAVVSLAGFLVFNRANRFSGMNVRLAVKPTAAVASGGTMTVTIEYQNQEPVNLVRAEVAVEYPEGFTFVSADRPSANQFNNDFSIGTIPTGRAGVVTITGTLIGSIDTTATFTATLTYRPANFNSDFQTKASGQAKITSSILDLSFDGPTKLAPGASGTWTITYTNTADKELQNVQLEAVYPNAFTVQTTKPTASERGAIWRLATVAKGASGTITITGTVNGSLGDSLTFIVRVGLVKATNTVDLQDEQSLLVILVNTGLTTTVAVNGATDQSTIEPGDTLQYTVRIANRSDVEVSDITVAVSLDGRPLNFSTLQNPMSAVVKNQTLTWTKKELAALTVLKPGQEVALNFSVGTVTPLTIQQDGDKDAHVTATVATSSPDLPVNTNSTNAAAIFITKVKTVFGLGAEARYYTDAGTAVGAGQLPPQVGQTTSYRIIWMVTNTTSEAADMVVTTTLPNTVFWTGQNVGRDAGDIAFDSATRSVRWTLNKVPAGTGSRLPKLTAHFDVSITPTSDQVGTVVVLSETTAATVTDSYSGASLTATAPSLTSDLPTDPQAAGQGKVQA